MIFRFRTDKPTTVITPPAYAQRVNDIHNVWDFTGCTGDRLCDYGFPQSAVATTWLLLVRHLPGEKDHARSRDRAGLWQFNALLLRELTPLTASHRRFPLNQLYGRWRTERGGYSSPHAWSLWQLSCNIWQSGRLQPQYSGETSSLLVFTFAVGRGRWR